MRQKSFIDFISDPFVSDSLPTLTTPKAQDELKERMNEVEVIEGMPKSSREEILRLSLPPYFTMCPNPFIQEFIGTSKDYRNTEILAAYTSDVVAGKNDPLYFLHFYSTKVPPDAIIPFILHYTRPGDIVLDGFCGTGMTGVAAQLCGDESRVGNKGEVGERRAILSDLSPAATFIAAGTNAVGVISKYMDIIEEILNDIEQRNRKFLETLHVGWPRGAKYEDRVNRRFVTCEYGVIEYIVWSDVFYCSSCGARLTYWDLVFRGPGMPTPKEAPCPECGSLESINTLQRSWVTKFDHELQMTIRQAEQVPVLINYRYGGSRFEKKPDENDLSLLEELSKSAIVPLPPIEPLPPGYNTEQPIKSHGFTHIHHFFTRRNLLLLTQFWSEVLSLKEPEARVAGLYVLTGSIQRVCRLNRYMPNHDRHVGPLSGTLYVAPLTAEIPATRYMKSRIKDIRRCSDGPEGNGVLISTQSATDLRNVPDASVDFVFTDPPFGANLNYSELNVLVEAWLKVWTDAKPEAVVNPVQQKELSDYQKIMKKCFSEYARVLKPGRWIVVEFHNSSNSVWTAIQEALWEAGFVVADVRTLDKKKGTTKQLSYASAVRQDLVISAYKPNVRFEECFKLTAGTEEGVWDFVRTHLKQLPVVVEKDGKLEVIAERQNYLLFDRMVAFHVQRGVTVPLSAAEFYAGLAQRFPERDGMYFLPEQVAEYDKKRMKVKEVLQLELFVKDEASAIQWLRQQLVKKPQTFQELHPQFLKEIGGWQKHEKPLELLELLEENFLKYDGEGPIPKQISSWLRRSSKWREVIEEEIQKGSCVVEDSGALQTSHPGLIAEAKDRWYVPDPNQAQDLEKLREKRLLKEFEDYKNFKGRRLKVFRLEAVRAGFKKAWQERDYATIIDVARKIPENVLQEDPKLLMWYDQAVTRMGGEV